MMKYYLFCFSLMLLFLNSCSIEKRTFNRGYYISFHSNKISSKNIANEDKINVHEKIDSEQEVLVLDSVGNLKDLASIENLNGLNYFEIPTSKQNEEINPSLDNKKSNLSSNKNHFIKEISSKNKDDEKFKRRGPVRVTNSLFVDWLIQVLDIFLAIWLGISAAIITFYIFLFMKAEYFPYYYQSEYRSSPKTLKSIFKRAFGISFRITFVLFTLMSLFIILFFLFVWFGRIFFALGLVLILGWFFWVLSDSSTRRGVSFLFFGWGK